MGKVKEKPSMGKHPPVKKTHNYLERRQVGRERPMGQILGVRNKELRGRFWGERGREGGIKQKREKKAVPEETVGRRVGKSDCHLLRGGGGKFSGIALGLGFGWVYAGGERTTESCSIRESKTIEGKGCQKNKLSLVQCGGGGHIFQLGANQGRGLGHTCFKERG